MITRDSSTIIAQCTPRGAGAIALLRLSGPHAWTMCEQIARIPGSKSIQDQASHTIHFARIVTADNTVLDQVMLLLMRGPKTFTGEDVVEITCHNNQILIEAVIQRALEVGAQPAQPGEFTQRAFAHGKIDLIQAEAIHDVITAQTQAALKKSLAQLEGSFSHWIKQLETELVRTLAWCEASFEFLDEEEEFGSQMFEHLKRQRTLITHLKKSFDQQQHIKQGIRIALVGSVNAGKSSLFNALIGQKRAIVSAQAGTTRDTIEAQLNRSGVFMTLVDTAGLRQTADVIEQEGIKRSHEEAHKADLVLMVIDGSRALSPEEIAVYRDLAHAHNQKIVTVITKQDLPAADGLRDHIGSSLSTISVSSSLGTGMVELERIIEKKIQELLARSDAPFLLNQRQFHVVATLDQQLEQIMLSLKKPVIQYELISYHLREALELLCELTGKSISEAGMDMVFKEFCVGK